MKNIFVVISVLIAVLLAVSCAGAAKGQEADPVPEAYSSDAAISAVTAAEPPIPEEPIPPPPFEDTEPEFVSVAEPEDIPEDAPVVEPEPEYIPEDIAEAVPTPEYIPEDIAEVEPVPEYIPEDIAEVEPTPEPEPPVSAPAIAIAEPQPLPPPPAPVRPLPEPVPSPEPPAVAREPIPRIVPDNELPNPGPGVTGRQEPAAGIQPGLSSPPDEVVNFSRIVHATVGQLVEIPFRGSGWVYLGEVASRRGIVYDSRKLDPEGQSFVFRTESAGVYTLAFYRQDFIRNFFLNDHVQVIVGEAAETSGTGRFSPSVDRSRVIAEPRWPSSLEEAQAIRGGNNTPAQPSGETAPAAAPPVSAPAQSSGGTSPAAAPAPSSPPVAASPSVADRPPESPAGTTVQPPVTPVSPPALAGDQANSPALDLQQASPDSAPNELAPEYTAAEYLSKAKEEFDAGRVDSAISLLDHFAYSPGAVMSDELYWLYGQFYEANSPSRNIRLSLDYYRRLIDEYPQSVRCNDAQRRISYLERYYINNR